MSPVLIGVTGGIGSGKSMVCRVCALRGIPVYDCDFRAKVLMYADPAIRAFLLAEVGEGAYRPDGSLNRALLSEHIFSNCEVRRRVEKKVHAAVREDLSAWLSSLPAGTSVALVESAILHTSGLDCMTSEIWLVEAPDEVRVRRVMVRSALSRDEVTARMRAQQTEFLCLPSSRTRDILNDGVTPLLPQIDTLLKQIIQN